MTRKLQYMPYATAHIEETPTGISLFSYSTEVIFIDCQGFMRVHGLYSATTRKHISAFMREFSEFHVDYYTAKKCYEKNIAYNIYTGEIKENDNFKW